MDQNKGHLRKGLEYLLDTIRVIASYASYVLCVLKLGATS